MAPIRHLARRTRIKSSSVKHLRTNAAILRGYTNEESGLSICHYRIFRPDILLYIIRKAGWSNAKLCEHNLKSGEYRFDLGDASYSSRTTTDAPTNGNSLKSVYKQMTTTTHGPLTPSNRLIPSTSEPTSLSDKPTTTPRTSRPIFKIPALPQRLRKKPLLSITISYHESGGPAMKAMKDYVSTIIDLEQHERCDPPLGDCSLSDGKSICWVNGETFIRLYDTTMSLGAQELRGVTERMDNYFHGGRLERNGVIHESHFPIAVVPSEPLTEVHLYPSLISTYRNASIFINLPIITRELFAGTDPNRCAFRVEKIEDELVVNTVIDGIFKLLAEKVGTSTICFRVKSWKDDTVRLVAVRVEVMADFEPDEEDECDEDVEIGVQDEMGVEMCV